MKGFKEYLSEAKKVDTDEMAKRIYDGVERELLSTDLLIPQDLRNKIKDSIRKSINIFI